MRIEPVILGLANELNDQTIIRMFLLAVMICFPYQAAVSYDYVHTYILHIQIDYVWSYTSLAEEVVRKRTNKEVRLDLIKTSDLRIYVRKLALIDGQTDGKSIL